MCGRLEKACRKCGSDHGPGYRVYFVRRGDIVVVLLAGGGKGSQDRDIQTALELARGL